MVVTTTENLQTLRYRGPIDDHVAVHITTEDLPPPPPPPPLPLHPPVRLETAKGVMMLMLFSALVLGAIVLVWLIDRVLLPRLLSVCRRVFMTLVQTFAVSLLRLMQWILTWIWT